MESQRAGTSVKDPLRYKPDVVRHIERFNQAVEHFRNVGHKWPKSAIQGTKLTDIKFMDRYEQFETWMFHTQKQYQGLDTQRAQT